MELNGVYLKRRRPPHPEAVGKLRSAILTRTGSSGGAVPDEYCEPKGRVQLGRDVQVWALSGDQEALFQQ